VLEDENNRLWTLLPLLIVVRSIVHVTLVVAVAVTATAAVVVVGKKECKE
jgi:hypothetical protein